MKKSNIEKLLTNPLYISLFLLTVISVISFGTMTQDEGMWSYIGRVWSQHGIPPYTGSIENKTPGIFALNAISYIIFGVNIFFLRGLGVLSILFSSLMVYCIGRKLHNHLSGILGMYIFGLTMTWPLLDGSLTAHTETFMILFSTASFYFVIKGKDSQKWKYWILLAGLSMGFAIAFKQIALTTALALFFFFLVYPTSNLTKQNKYFGLILLGLGIGISTMLSITPLFLSGVSLKEYINGAWLILLNPASSAGIKDHLSGFFKVWEESRIVFFYPFLFLIFWQKEILKNKYFIGLLIWLLFDFIGVNSSGYYYGHQIKQLIPSLSVIIGVLLGNLMINFNRTEAVNSKYVSILITAIIITMFPYQKFLKNSYLIFTKQSNPVKEIGTWLRDNTYKNDYVYIMGGQSSPILSYSERISSSKHFSEIFISTDRDKDLVFYDLKHKPPVYIIKRRYLDHIETLRYDDVRIDSLIENSYSIVQRKYDWDIYMKN